MSLNRYTQCVKLTRKDGVILGMTVLDADITFDSQLYKGSLGYTPTETQGTANLSVNNADIKGFLTVGGLERSDIVGGLYDYAELYFFLFDFGNEVKVRDLESGTIGEITLEDNAYTAEYRSKAQLMQQTIGRVYGAECDAKLGDARCGVTLASFTVNSAITSVTSNSVFSDTARVEADDLFNYGLITFTSGLNNGISREIKSFSSGQFTTHLAFPFEVLATDTYTAYQGCNKQQAICIAKFNNIDNFRGFPFIIGSDALLKFGGQ